MSTEYSHSHAHNYHSLIVDLPDADEDLLSWDAFVVLSNSNCSIPYIVNRSLPTESVINDLVIND